MTDADRILKHTIAELDYSEGYLECSCGAVMLADPAAGAWLAHRRTLGLNTPTLASGSGRLNASSSQTRGLPITIVSKATRRYRDEVGRG